MSTGSKQDRSYSTARNTRDGDQLGSDRNLRRESADLDDPYAYQAGYDEDDTEEEGHKRRDSDALWHLTDALSEDILNTGADELFAEVAEDHQSRRTLTTEFDRISRRSLRRARRQRHGERLRQLIGRLANLRWPTFSGWQWSGLGALAAATVAIAVFGFQFWLEQPSTPMAVPERPSATTIATGLTNGPLSLAPQAQSALRVAETTSDASSGRNSRLGKGNEPPHRESLMEARTAIEPAAGAASGGYLVQVSSQRNEADAQASFRALQNKFPFVLGSQTPLIKRADLGENGTYYRVMVGPFAASEEAAQFCGNLKRAGGQCIVQRN